MDSVSSSIVGHHTQGSRVPRARDGGPSCASGRSLTAQFILYPPSPPDGCRQVKVSKSSKLSALADEDAWVARSRLVKSAALLLASFPARDRLGPRFGDPARALVAHDGLAPPAARGAVVRIIPLEFERTHPEAVLSPRSMDSARTPNPSLSLQGRRSRLGHFNSPKSNKLVEREGKGPEQRSAYLSHHRAKLEGWTS